MTDDPQDAAGAARPQPTEPPEQQYRTEQFAFVHEQAPPESTGWLAFGDSRAGRRADRRERFRERLVLGGVLIVLLAVVAGVVLWRPWASSVPADTGDLALGTDRVAVLLQVQDADGAALATGILMHDRRDGGTGAAVAVPADLQLPVAGEGDLTVARALDDAGPTRSREAVAELLGVELAGSWVLDRDAFARLVDRLGGIPDWSGSRTAALRLDGAGALARLGGAEPADGVLGGLGSAFPAGFTGARDLLIDLGVLDSPGLSVDRLGALTAGLARDADSGRLGTATLPLEGNGRGVDVAGALPIVRDLLGGAPGAGRGEDVTPRVLVRLAPGAATTAADARADIVGAGYEYVDGGTLPVPATGSTVTVRTGVPDGQALGEAVAQALGLPTSVVRVADDVPFVADVAVVLGPPPKP